MSSWVEYTPPVWRNLQMRELKVDQAYLVPKSERKSYIYSLSEECYTCPYTKVKVISPDEIVEPLKLTVDHSIRFKVFDHDVGRYAPDNLTSTCSLQPSMREFGVYNFSIYSNGSCEIITDKPGVNVNLSILSVILISLLVYAITQLSLYAYKKYRSWSSTEIVISTAGPDHTANPVEKRRMRSLDAFRGLVIVLMIFVNTGGGGYWWIEHAPWNGLHLADIVFPSFLWIMGVCIPISIKSQLARGATKRSICKKICWRSIKMFLIGVCLNSMNGPQMADLRIMGVLQRFGVAFLVVGIVHTTFAKREYVMPQSGCRRAIFDLILLKEQILVVIALIAISLGITYGVNAPGCPRGYLGPGGKHSDAAYPDCIGGIVGYVDRLILGESHIYQHPTAKYIYDSRAFDPEGLFGCILTVVQVFFGVICGTILITHTEVLARVKRWSIWAVGLGLFGGILCLFSTEGGWVPLNKNMWSFSFVLVTSSIAFILLCVMYYVIDVKQIWSGYPFAECGMNAIVLYVGHTVFHKMLPWHWAIGAMNTHFMLLLKSLWTTFLWIVAAVYLDKVQFYYSL